MADRSTLHELRGAARCPGRSTRDIILADGDTPPPALLASGGSFLGDQDLSFERYTSPAVYDREMERLWPRVWQWACREDQLAETGDYLVYDIGPHSILLTRTASNGIKGFYNACLHRGTQLRAAGTSGFATELRCPFHGWAWTLDGELKTLPCRWDFPHVEDAAFRLPEVRVATWGGFVFINLDPDAAPLEQHLGILSDHFQDRWDLSRRTTTLHVQKLLPTNWKAAQEAFLEAYHIVETHAQALLTASDANAQYDVFGDTVTRFVHAIGVPSPHRTDQPSEQQVFDAMRVGSSTPLAAGQTARHAAAASLRNELGAAWNVDLRDHSTSEMIDSIEYHLFPNMCLFPGIAVPMIYRFRPLAVDRTLFDILFLRPLAPDETPPPPPEPVRVDVEESYASVPGLHPGLANIFDQDTGTLAMQYAGIKASKKRGQTLGNYQELRIRHFHQALDQWLA